jgi:DNA/RNA-binding domain of Phe-tRNA-synthetase-like protein
MSHQLRVDPRIYETYPDYAVLVIYARGLRNGPSDARSTRLLREAEARQRLAFGEQKPSSHAHIAAWRAAFGQFGAKPSKYLCSVEALLGRTLRGNDLPSINQVVDLYNAVSIAHVLPAGGEDWDQLVSDSRLTFADGTEPFEGIGDSETSFPEPGEVIWADAAGVTCRRWNWRQCARTALTTETTNAYFVLDRLPPFTLEQLRAAGAELTQLLRDQSPGCELESCVLSAHTDE